MKLLHPQPATSTIHHYTQKSSTNYIYMYISRHSVVSHIQRRHTLLRHIQKTYISAYTSSFTHNALTSLYDYTPSLVFLAATRRHYVPCFPPPVIGDTWFPSPSRAFHTLLFLSLRGKGGGARCCFNYASHAQHPGLRPRARLLRLSKQVGECP
jgi:hypothetical protein